MRINIFNKSQTHTLNKDLAIDQAGLDGILQTSFRPLGNEVVLWNKESLLNKVQSNLATARENINNNPDTLNEIYTGFLDQMKIMDASRLNSDRVFERTVKHATIYEIITGKKKLSYSNISDIKEHIHTNKETIISDFKLTTTPLTQTKPLGSAGDITLNELITKGLDVMDTPLVKMIKEHVDIQTIGSCITSMIMYKAVMKLYMKSAYEPCRPVVPLSGACTRPREIALFMLMGAPAIVVALMTINAFTAGGTKIILNVAENTELEGSSSGSISSFSFFLFLNKLPSWLKIVLKYIALSFIISFITSVIGYNSNILSVVYSQINIYLVYFLKLYSILNFLVVLYYLWRLYVLKMFANNKEYLNPEDYIKFIKNELIELKNITIQLSPIELEKFYKHYYFLICLYVSIVLLCLTGLIISSIY